jgi:hypothetical protein
MHAPQHPIAWIHQCHPAVFWLELAEEAEANARLMEAVYALSLVESLVPATENTPPKQAIQAGTS